MPGGESSSRERRQRPVAGAAVETEEEEDRAIVRQGVLWKRRDIFRNRWRPRWFVLQPQQGLLTYYLFSSSDGVVAATTAAEQQQWDSYHTTNTTTTILPSSSLSSTHTAATSSSHHHQQQQQEQQLQLQQLQLQQHEELSQEHGRHRTISYDSIGAQTGLFSELSLHQQALSESVVPRGTIYLPGCRIQRNDSLSRVSVEEEQLFAFTIHVPPGALSTTTTSTTITTTTTSAAAATTTTVRPHQVFLAARTAQARELWMQQLARVCGYQQPPPSQLSSSSSSPQPRMDHHPSNSDNDNLTSATTVSSLPATVGEEGRLPSSSEESESESDHPAPHNPSNKEQEQKFQQEEEHKDEQPQHQHHGHSSNSPFAAVVTRTKSNITQQQQQHAASSSSFSRSTPRRNHSAPIQQQQQQSLMSSSQPPPLSSLSTPTRGKNQPSLSSPTKVVVATAAAETASASAASEASSSGDSWESIRSKEDLYEGVPDDLRDLLERRIQEYMPMLFADHHHHDEKKKKKINNNNDQQQRSSAAVTTTESWKLYNENSNNDAGSDLIQRKRTYYCSRKASNTTNNNSKNRTSSNSTAAATSVTSLVHTTVEFPTIPPAQIFQTLMDHEQRPKYENSCSMAHRLYQYNAHTLVDAYQYTSSILPFFPRTLACVVHWRCCSLPQRQLAGSSLSDEEKENGLKETDDNTDEDDDTDEDTTGKAILMVAASCPQASEKWQQHEKDMNNTTTAWMESNLVISMALVRPLSRRRNGGTLVSRLVALDPNVPGWAQGMAHFFFVGMQAKLPKSLSEHILRRQQHHGQQQETFDAAASGSMDVIISDEYLRTLLVSSSSSELTQDSNNKWTLGKSKKDSTSTTTQPVESDADHGDKKTTTSSAAAAAQQETTNNQAKQNQSSGLSSDRRSPSILWQAACLLAPTVLYLMLQWHEYGQRVVVVLKIWLPGLPEKAHHVSLGCFVIAVWWSLRQWVLAQYQLASMPPRSTVHGRHQQHHHQHQLLESITCQFSIRVKGSLRYITNHKEEQQEMRRGVVGASSALSTPLKFSNSSSSADSVNAAAARTNDPASHYHRPPLDNINNPSSGVTSNGAHGNGEDPSVVVVSVVHIVTSAVARVWSKHVKAAAYHHNAAAAAAPTEQQLHRLQVPWLALDCWVVNPSKNKKNNRPNKSVTVGIFTPQPNDAASSSSSGMVVVPKADQLTVQEIAKYCHTVQQQQQRGNQQQQTTRSGSSIGSIDTGNESLTNDKDGDDDDNDDIPECAVVLAANYGYSAAPSSSSTTNGEETTATTPTTTTIPIISDTSTWQWTAIPNAPTTSLVAVIGGLTFEEQKPSLLLSTNNSNSNDSKTAIIPPPPPQPVLSLSVTVRGPEAAAAAWKLIPELQTLLQFPEMCDP